MLAAAILACVALPLEDLPLSDGVVELRLGTPDDAHEAAACLRDPEIPRWTRVPAGYTKADWHEFLQLAGEGLLDGTDVSLLAVTVADRRIAGAVGLHDIDRDAGRAEIGYWVAARLRGQGIATRAVRLVTAWAVDRLGLRELTILVHRDNVASRRVPERAGYADTGERLPPPAAGLPGGEASYMRYVFPPPRR
jgi:RimJ/RimL family protein N-acetyltransferase